jgi:hypothetical protein
VQNQWREGLEEEYVRTRSIILYVQNFTASGGLAPPSPFAFVCSILSPLVRLCLSSSVLFSAMGKKDKFIDKANSQKFHLMHRSLTDEAHANYEVPSNFVLVPAATVSVH